MPTAFCNRRVPSGRPKFLPVVLTAGFQMMAPFSPSPIGTGHTLYDPDMIFEIFSINIVHAYGILATSYFTQTLKCPAKKSVMPTAFTNKS